MTSKKYRLSAGRLIVLWLLPAFFIVLMAVIIHTKYRNTNPVTATELTVWILFFVFGPGIFVLLFLNHLPLARHTELLIKDKILQISQGGSDYIVSFNDITEITEYSSGKLPWGYIMKWTIKIPDHEITISSLTISQQDLERYFYNTINKKISLLPWI